MFISFKTLLEDLDLAFMFVYIYVSGVVRHTDMKITVMKKEIYMHRFLEKGGTVGVQGHMGKEAERVRENTAWLLTRFLQEGIGK